MKWNHKLAWKIFQKVSHKDTFSDERFDFNYIPSVGAVCDLTKSTVEILNAKSFIEGLEKINSSVSRTRILAYSDINELTEQYELEVFNKNDFNFIGKPNKSSVIEFIEEPFDLLLDFSQENNPYIEHVINISNSSFNIQLSQKCIGRKINVYFNIKKDVEVEKEKIFKMLEKIK